MSALTYREFLRLRMALKIKWQGLALLGLMLEHETMTPAELRAALAECGYVQNSRKVMDVVLCQLNRALPATIRIVPVFPEGGRGRKGRGIGGTVAAEAYALSSDWAREYLMRVARGEDPLAETNTEQERAA